MSIGSAAVELRAVRDTFLDGRLKWSPALT
jgi:hypothetical protein